LNKETLHSDKYPERAHGTYRLIRGNNTREDYRELGLELLGRYGYWIEKRREQGGEINYDHIRRAVEIHDRDRTKTMPMERWHDGFPHVMWMRFEGVMQQVDRHGPEVLEMNWPG